MNYNVVLAIVGFSCIHAVHSVIRIEVSFTPKTEHSDLKEETDILEFQSLQYDTISIHDRQCYVLHEEDFLGDLFRKMTPEISPKYQGPKVHWWTVNNVPQKIPFGIEIFYQQANFVKIEDWTEYPGEGLDNSGTFYKPPKGSPIPEKYIRYLGLFSMDGLTLPADRTLYRIVQPRVK